jgi:hypothetical protein
MKIRLIILLSLHCVLHEVAAQSSIKGEIRRISANEHDSSVWLASDAGIVYRTKNFSSDLKPILTLPEPKASYFGDKTISLEFISFFNRDTLFISGYLGDDLIGKERNETNKIFRSVDGGMHWETVPFCTKGIWVYDILLKKNGTAVLGGSDGKLYDSRDFGASWKKLSSPFNDKTRMACLDERNGIGLVGALGNNLKLSRDGLKSFSSIETPSDQKAYIFSKEARQQHAIRDECSHIQFINDSVVLMGQENFVFSSNIHKIDWKRFSPELTRFSFDPTKGIVVGLTADNKVVSFNSALQFDKEVVQLNADEHLIDMEALNGNIYLLSSKYFPQEKGEDVVGTFGSMQMVRVGYRKVSHYIVYRINKEGIKRLEISVGK